MEQDNNADKDDQDGSKDEVPKQSFDRAATAQIDSKIKIEDIINTAKAHWLSREYIAWPVDFDSDSIFKLYFAQDGDLDLTPPGNIQGKNIELTFISNTLNEDLAEKFPHLRNACLLRIPDPSLNLVPEILKGQFAIQARAPENKDFAATSLQIPGVLDNLYANDRALGLTWQGSVPTLCVWAPTAKSVKLHLYDSPPETESAQVQDGDLILPMQWDSTSGIWSLRGEPGWKHKYYLYEVQVYVRQEGAVVTNKVTDPYSLSLSTNSLRSQIVDLKDRALLPEDWSTFQKPDLSTLSDIVLYELHLRDFSIRDPSIPSEHRGTYLAFTHPESYGMKHLKWLAEHGVTHIHLLPVFDFATVNENREQWTEIDWELLKSLPPDSERQQRILKDIRGKDGYNWGYDPFHYTVPEGSYSLNPNNQNRILEFRRMVQSIHQIGLRVVMDVVYNHTHASGQDDKSVLDKIVPGYYHRLDEEGRVATSTCCQNTATEHAMMRKLMIESVRTWAVDYKIDGFRFDLMGHHMKADMLALREELDALTLRKDGVDGASIYLYGEGWDFGEVANNRRGVNATQRNLAGTGIGTFNDRIRDAVRGGSPFGDPTEQGYATGLFTAPNKIDDPLNNAPRETLLQLKDLLRISLTGNLADYPLENYQGETVTGAEIKYKTHPVGYTKNPLENIPYISAHDNETLFDAIQYKVPRDTSILDRVKIQNLALSLVTFSQGIPFYHAGTELLRSKSMDRDSYDSTDWFNAIDWTYQENNWGHGLPPKDKNGGQWPLIRELLSDPSLSLSPEDILLSRDLFGMFLKIRSGSPLFRLQTADAIKASVHFHNTGPDQVPGLIVMSILDDDENPIDQKNKIIFVVFNADPNAQTFKLKGWQLHDLSLHPELLDTPYAKGAGFDHENQIFSLPARSTMVFISPTAPRKI